MEESMEKMKKKLAAFEKLTAQLLVENDSLKEELEGAGKSLSGTKNPAVVKEIRKAVSAAMDDGIREFSMKQRFSSMNKADSLANINNSNNSNNNTNNDIGSGQQNHSVMLDSEPVMISLMSGDEITFFHDGKVNHNF
jgi:hypothetical protein